MVPRSFEYATPWLLEDPDSPVCPRCKREIQPGQTVHWYDAVLWHTSPCP